jgi:hypothetical protein
MTAIFAMIALNSPTCLRLDELVFIKYHQQAISIVEYQRIAGLIKIATLPLSGKKRPYNCV